MIRAIALAARLDFTIEPTLVEAIRTHRREIAKSSQPRLLEEYYKILRAGSAETRVSRARRTSDCSNRPRASCIKGATDALWRSLAALDAYRRRFDATPDTLTNSILLGSLLVPLGISIPAGAHAGRTDAAAAARRAAAGAARHRAAAADSRPAAPPAGPRREPARTARAGASRTSFATRWPGSRFTAARPNWSSTGRRWRAAMRPRPRQRLPQKARTPRRRHSTAVADAAVAAAASARRRDRTRNRSLDSKSDTNHSG